MKNNIKKPELVSPAGDWSSLRSAISSGADSVYFGVKGINMRNLASNFDILEIKKVMDVLHRNKRRGYLALNVIVYDREINKITKILKEAKISKVDAVIAWDMAVFFLAKKLGLKIHLSTQASISNFLALKQYYALGARRIVLARENRLCDIKNIIQAIKKEKINCEIETFIHGAMCISISGRCFLSEHSFTKSANRGECLQPCRREFTITDVEGDSQYILGRDYLLSPKDLCTIDFLDNLIKAGINAFKIEGRNRSPEYVKVVTAVYRRAIDCFFSGKLDNELKARLKKELKTVYTRGFSSGFYWGEPKDSNSRVLENTYEKVYAGEVIKFYKKINVAEIRVRNESLKKGAQILCIGKNTPASFAEISDIQINHEFVEELTKGQTGGVKLPFGVRRNDKVFIWRKKIESG
ncbi:MAG: U32 family peptidase [Omnitrophica bacterium]|nr:U32 family peptidase [Candidatus Omnitrophota bacterium]